MDPDQTVSQISPSSSSPAPTVSPSSSATSSNTSYSTGPRCFTPHAHSTGSTTSCHSPPTSPQNSTEYKKVIDFHVHVGRQEDWHPWVNDFLRKENPILFQGDNFNRTMTPDGLDYLLEQNGIWKAVILAEYSPLTTGVVTNEYVQIGRASCRERV